MAAMSTGMPATLAHDELLRRLAREPCGALTVVTPNHRLAQDLARAVGEIHAAAGRRSWPAPDILALPQWLERLHEEARFDDRGEPEPPLLSPDQELLGWEGVISRDAGRTLLTGPAALARQTQAAWQLACDWDIEGALGTWEGGEDAAAFAAWSGAWQAHMRRHGWLDRAALASRLPAWLARPGVRRPATLVAFAFQILTPAQRRVFEACRAAGIAVEIAGAPRHAGAPRVVRAESPRREIEVAARWARAQLESARPGRAPHIAVVVPDLAKRRESVRRAFSRVFAPSGRTAGGALFNLSLGRALADYPLADFALCLIDLADGAVDFAAASRVLRSPFLGESMAEFEPRARLDMVLRKAAPPRLDLEDLARLVATCTQESGRASAPRCRALEARLAALASTPRPGRLAAPHAWAAFFAQQLSAAGFPGERPLDSAEHQVLGKWHEALSRLASLGPVVEALKPDAARRHLRRLCADTLFQPESGEAPVQVLGLLESVGLSFDALWVTGLTDDAWPQSPRPDPFLPVSLQRKAGLPQASAEASLALDAEITRSWASAAPEVIFSHGLLDEERALEASPLLAPYPVAGEASLALAPYEGLREALFAAGRDPGAWDGKVDERAPPLGEHAAIGGTAILADQAACPFRAYAHHRLGAEGLEAAQPGLGAAERGKLLHALMARVWRDLGSHAALVAAPAERIEQIVAEAARAAVKQLQGERPGRLDGRFADLERARLAQAARDWLDIDRERAPFDVVSREEKLALVAGTLVLNGRIDRLDRLASGGVAVIDYKSGAPSVSGWLGARPEDPQLPLYALGVGEEVVAVAFARLKKGKLGFAGLAREDGLLPGVKSVSGHAAAKKVAASWKELLEGWRETTTNLAGDFVRGDARVDPKRPFATCEYCDLAALCRVREQLAGKGDEEPAEEEGRDE